MFVIGFISAGFIGINKLHRLYTHQKTILVTENPWFYIAMTTMIIGTQLFLAGFLGEIILRTRSNAERYSISRTVNL
jgi:choline-glycine betaine transporter